ncbi:MAG: D-hexose-6-phosphate mutarotase [Tepidisphaerales bacterium]
MATRLLTGEGGLPKLVIDTSAGVAEVHLLGACVTRYAAGGREVLFISKTSPFVAGKPIRGGVPVCWPWFGPPPAAGVGPGVGGGNPLPQHGFARTQMWDIVEMGAERAVLELRDSVATRALFPRAFRLRYAVTVGGDGLTMALETTNTDPVAFTYGEALHTYLSVPDVREVSLTGLSGQRYRDKTAGGAEKTESDGPVRLTGETDRVYTDTYGPHELHWGGAKRVVVHKSNSADTVLWNPWAAKAEAMPDLSGGQWPGFVCVETVNTGEHAVTLAPGQSHTTVCRLEVVA